MQGTHAGEGDCSPVVTIQEQLPIRPASLAADTGYNDGRLRQHLKELDITAYIPVHPNQERSMVAKGGFDYRGDHLMCPEGKRLRRGALEKEGPSIHVRCSSEGLPAVSYQEQKLAYGTEATICVSEHVLSLVLRDESAKQE